MEKALTDFCLFVDRLIVGITRKIGGFPPIFTDKTHQKLEKTLVKKSADFFGRWVIVWCDICFKAGSHREDCERLET